MGAITSAVLPETVANLDDLAQRAEAFGCGVEFAKFLDRLQRRWAGKTDDATFPIAVLFGVRRPFRLIGRASTIELLLD